jgi:hypothetical protein
VILPAATESRAIATLLDCDSAYQIGLFGTLEVRQASWREWVVFLEGRRQLFDRQDEACRYFQRRRRKAPGARLRTQSSNTLVLDPDEEYRRGSPTSAAILLVRKRLERRIGFEFEHQGGSPRSVPLHEVLRRKGTQRDSVQDRETAALMELFSWYIGYDCQIRFGADFSGELLLRTLEDGRLAFSSKAADRSFARCESALRFHLANRKAGKATSVRQGRSGNGARCWIVEHEPSARLLSDPAAAAAAFMAARRTLRRRHQPLFPPAPLPFLP